MQFTENIPQSFCCPITHLIMNNPYVDNEGNTYELSAIKEWLTKKKESPITRNFMNETHLTPNRALKDLIDKWIQDHTKTEAKSSLEEKESIDLSPVNLDITSNNNYTCISVKTPEGIDRLPLNICCVVDVSGSMQSEAVIKGENGNNESHGLTLLQLVAQAVKAIIKTLEPKDKLSIVKYSNQASIVFPLEHMTPAGKARALVSVASLDPEGCTNLWDGLNTGLEILRADNNTKCMSSVILLTDGQPNVEPPRGHLPMLNKYKDSYPDFMGSCILNSFAFGYNANSVLLNELSVCGNGSYSFIPDPGFVGTVFEHCIANLLTTFATNVILSIENINNSRFEDIYYPYGYQKTSWGYNINLGNLKFGQSKEIIFKFKRNTNNPIFMNTTLKFNDLRKKKFDTISKFNSENFNDKNVEVHFCRYLFAESIKKAMNYMMIDDIDNAGVIINSLLLGLKSSSVKDNSYIKDLIKDVEDQVVKACSRKDWYQRWGCHYLISLVHAHLVQECNNFKDPGVQHFGGKLFKKIRDKSDDIYNNLPVPKPNITHRSVYRSAAPPTSMSHYSQSSGPCFDGNCVVHMHDGSKKKIKDLVKGDVVLTPTGKTAKILCIVKTLMTNNIANLVNLGGLLVTEWHPIKDKLSKKWTFPCKIKSAEETSCPAVYSFVLDTKYEHVMVINDIECIALGHNIKLPVAKHDYWGTNKVIKDLQKMKGWVDGLVILKDNCIIRNKIGEAIRLNQTF